MKYSKKKMIQALIDFRNEYDADKNGPLNAYLKSFGINYLYFMRVKRGTFSPNVSYFFKICALLKMNPEDFCE